MSGELIDNSSTAQGDSGDVEYGLLIDYPNTPYDGATVANAMPVFSAVGENAATDEVATANEGGLEGGSYGGGDGSGSAPGAITDPIREEDNSAPPVHTGGEGGNTPPEGAVDYDFKLSDNFKLRECTIDCIFPHTVKSSPAGEPEDIITNLSALAKNVLEPLRAKYPGFRINSGFRSYTKGRSQHEKGQAVDIQWPGASYDTYWERAKWVKDNLPFDQFIYEFGNSVWFHLSWNGPPRGSVLTMSRNKYSPGLKRVR